MQYIKELFIQGEYQYQRYGGVKYLDDLYLLLLDLFDFLFFYNASISCDFDTKIQPRMSYKKSISASESSKDDSAQTTEPKGKSLLFSAKALQRIYLYLEYVNNSFFKDLMLVTCIIFLTHATSKSCVIIQYMNA